MGERTRKTTDDRVRDLCECIAWLVVQYGEESDEGMTGPYGHCALSCLEDSLDLLVENGFASWVNDYKARVVIDWAKLGVNVIRDDPE